MCWLWNFLSIYIYILYTHCQITGFSNSSILCLIKIHLLFYIHISLSMFHIIVQLLLLSSGMGSEMSNAGIPITSFRVQDILDGVVYYVNNKHRNIEPVHDGFLFYITDGENASPEYRFNISIQVCIWSDASLWSKVKGQGSVSLNLHIPGKNFSYECVSEMS